MSANVLLRPLALRRALPAALDASVLMRSTTARRIIDHYLSS
jgi:hypothetical protein